jgi:hypothetical protein
MVEIVTNDVSLDEITSKKAYTYPYPSVTVKCSGDRVQELIEKDMSLGAYRGLGI